MATASGKVILAGEHAVVYGCPALALGLALGVEARAEVAGDNALVFGSEPCEDPTTLLAYQRLLERLESPSMCSTVALHLPPGVGLGASAAVAIAVARAVSDAAFPDAPRTHTQLLDAAGAWESVFHGNPSGIDTAAALLGGCIGFQKDNGFRRLAVARGFVVGVAVAGPPSSTKTMVDSVARIRARNPDRFAETLAAIEALVRNAENFLASGDLKALGTLLDYNHMLLAGWLLSTNEIEDAIRIARAEGALGAKLTGAGGGGCVIALLEKDTEPPLLAAWRKAGLRCFATPVEAH